MFYVYLLRRPDKADPFEPGKGQPFYVGKGINGRVKEHRWRAKTLFNLSIRKTIKIKIIHKLWVNDLDYEEEVIWAGGSEKQALFYECQIIADYGRMNNKTGCLSNLTDGGEGSCGFIHSEESLKILSALAKKKKGNKNPNYKDDLITLKHFDGRILEHTRYEWFSIYELKHAPLCGIILGKFKSYKGWMLPKTTLAETGSIRKGVNHPLADHTKHNWQNIDGRKEYCTRLELRAKYNIASGDISGVMCGRHSHVRGWFIEGSKNKINKIGKDDKIHILINVNGEKAEGLRKQLEDLLGLNQQEISSLLVGRRKSSHGWMLPQTSELGYKPRYYDPK